MAELLHVDVVFADVAAVVRKSVQIEPGATVADAVRVSGIAANLGAGGIDASRIGVFGRVVSSTTLLRDGDRVEIYRPLRIDPKEARRRRAGK
jgi:putative ubiquitin-RnfH superfamily antitoxin RatB of RatAB toxin-antitoxin module